MKLMVTTQLICQKSTEIKAMGWACFINKCNKIRQLRENSAMMRG